MYIKQEILFKFISYAILFYLIFASIIEHTSLPDYESYFRIYNETDSYITDTLFVSLVAFSYDYLKVSYEDFRFYYRFVCVFFLYIGILMIKAELLKYRSKKITYYKNSGLFYTLVFLAMFIIFLFSIYSVRIRAGGSISFFIMFLAFAVRLINKRTFLNIFLGLTFLIISSLFHFSTAMVLVYFLALPMFLAYYLDGKDISKKRFLSSIHVRYFLPILIAVVIVYYIILKSVDRGEHLYTEINSFRLIFVSFIPICIFIFYRLNTGIFNIKRELSRYSNKYNWCTLSQYMIASNFVFFSCIIIVFDMLGFISTAGEAIVRIINLSSVFSIVAYLYAIKTFRTFWLYIISINSLFFLNTLLTVLYPKTSDNFSKFLIEHS
jgi:hypothetical protein